MEWNKKDCKEEEGRIEVNKRKANNNKQTQADRIQEHTKCCKQSNPYPSTAAYIRKSGKIIEFYAPKNLKLHLRTEDKKCLLTKAQQRSALKLNLIAYAIEKQNCTRNQ